MIIKSDFFIKFGNSPYIENFYNHGELCFSPLVDFRTIENKSQGDLFEGTTSVENLSKGTASVKIDDEWKKLKFKTAQIRKFYDSHFGSSLSLYHINDSLFRRKAKHKIDKRMLNFGNMSVLINDVPEFLNRLETALKKENLSYTGKKVVYKNFKIPDKMETTSFIKRHQYSYQHEYRLILPDSLPKKYIIKIGPLTDIARIHTSIELVENLEIVSDKSL